MSQKMNFTKKALSGLKCREKQGRLYVYDTATKGLGLRVTRGGSKSFVFYRFIDGRPKRITLGRFPDMTIEQARGKVGGLNEKLSKGERIESDSPRKSMTFGEMFALFLEGHGKVRKRSWKGDQYNYEKHLKKWSKHQLKNIHKSDVMALHSTIGKKSGLYMANRVLALIRKLYNHAGDLGIEIPNPAIHVNPFKEEKRARFLGSRESDNVEKFFQVVLNWPNAKPQGEESQNKRALAQDEKARDVVILAVLTGARKANLLSMRWNEINFETSTWEIPGHKSKSGEAMQIPLTRDAIEILRNRKTVVENKALDTPWVFPGRSPNKPLTAIEKQWREIRTAAGFKTSGPDALRFHDLRRTLGSFQAMGGSSLLVIGKSLGHRRSVSTEIYSRLKIDPVRESVERATSMLFDLAKVERKEADIVEAVGEK